MDEWRPLKRVQGYLPIADHGLIGDGRTCALVGRDGAVGFMCVPRFDSAPLFASLLDHRRGGGLLIAPARVVASRQRYVPDTGVLVTEMRGPEGGVEITDAFLLAPGAFGAGREDRTRGTSATGARDARQRRVEDPPQPPLGR
ncbi:trehalase-like domain-containing protein [Streptomyces sp. NPDC007883]|uniref:trehalase-like domain-containing protein n=1 Tax=Streptomyces sp. NPDC007883 TaxID=3155116 RepID=UPI0033EEC598